MSSALAADCVWFNSEFHRTSFLKALEDFLKRMPDNQPMQAVDAIRDKSSVYPPGIEKIEESGEPEKNDEPLRILWAARWEYDKNPDDFFTALKVLKQEGFDFKLDVIGKRLREYSEIFGWAREYFAGHITRWGYRENRDEYVQALGDADVLVSTARHEFFGLSALEAAGAGTAVILPDRLAYPEIFKKDEQGREFFYDGSVEELVEKLKRMIKMKREGKIEQLKYQACDIAIRYHWGRHSKVLDDGLEAVI